MFIQILETSGTDYSTHVFDILYSYCQYHNIDFDFEVIHNKDNFSHNSIKVLLLDIKPEISKDYIIHNYDFVFLCNSAEHMAVSSDEMYDYLHEYNNVYGIVGSFIHKEFSFADKLIPFMRDSINCKNWFANANTYISHYYHNYNNLPTKNILFINGQNRTQRQDWINHIAIHSNKIINNTPLISKQTKKSKFASEHDNQYIDYCNEKYPVDLDTDQIKKTNNFSDEILFGKNGKHGVTRRGYFPINEYYDSGCVVYPESNFFANEFYPTEKTHKCIFLKKHWIAITGKNAYAIMRDNGIRSIVELCPDSINDFDSEDDWFIKVKKISKCVEYIKNNKHIFDSKEAQKMLDDNFYNFVCSSSEYNAAKKLYNILQTKISDK